MNGLAGLAAGPTQKPATSSGSATTRGLPIGTVNGIQDSDVVCAQNGYQGAACGLANVASIYNPNPNMRYQTQYSDNAISLLQSTNRYNAAGQRLINPATGNAVMDLNSIDIPTQNAAASGVATTTGNGRLLQQSTVSLNNGALSNYIAPSASNAVLPNSVAYQQANAAPWTTTPVNTLTGAGFGYSTLLGATAGSMQAPVPTTGTAGTMPTTFSSGFSSLPASFSNSWAQPYTQPGSYMPPTNSYYPSNFGNSYQNFPTSNMGNYAAPYYPTSNFGSSYGSSFQMPSYNPAAQPFTNAYSTPGALGPASQAGIARRY